MKYKNLKMLTVLGAGLMMLSGCAEKDTEKNLTETEPEIVGVYEAEQARLSKNLSINDKIAGFSGEGYVEGLEEDGDACTFQITIEEDGFYDLQFVTANIGGYKENYVLADGVSIGTLPTEKDSFEEGVLQRCYLTAGEHEIAIEKYWGYIAIDRLSVLKSVPLPDDYYTVCTKLCNPDASENAKRVMSYLLDNYGVNVISGQYSDEGMYGHEMACIWSETKKFPAMLGLDMIEYSPSRAANGSEGKSIEQAMEAWEEGSLITMCWHWNAPEKYLTGVWYSGFYKEYTNIDLDKIMNGQDEEGYELLMADMDAIAGELQKLQKADVPILWRPLHEASGGWFWWGNCEAESYKKLYRLMYEKFTGEYGLNNLIWVWNGQDKEWYPGDDVVDIVGEDIYPGEKVYTSQMDKFMKVHEYADSNKMVVMSENGCLFDPDLAIRDGAMWGYFGTWGGEFVEGSTTMNIYSEQYTETDMLKKVYDHPNVITRDELPDLKNYPIREDVN